MIVANDPNALLLPYDHYFNFWDEGMPEDARFVHFIGSCRHSGSAYIDATRAAISALRAAGEGIRGRPEPAPPSTGERCQRAARALLLPPTAPLSNPEERRVGKECVSTMRSGWST